MSHIINTIRRLWAFLYSRSFNYIRLLDVLPYSNHCMLTLRGRQFRLFVFSSSSCRHVLLRLQAIAMHARTQYLRAGHRFACRHWLCETTDRTKQRSKFLFFRSSSCNCGGLWVKVCDCALLKVHYWGMVRAGHVHAWKSASQSGTCWKASIEAWNRPPPEMEGKRVARHDNFSSSARVTVVYTVSAWQHRACVLFHGDSFKKAKIPAVVFFELLLPQPVMQPSMSLFQMAHSTHYAWAPIAWSETI